MGHTRAQIGEILAHHALFEGLARSDIEQLADRAKMRHCKRHEPVFAMGDPGDSMMAVLSGTVRIKLYSAEGKEVVVAIFGPGAIFGEIAMIDGGERTADADTLEETELMVLERRDFMPFAERHPKVALRLLEIMCKRFRDVDKKIIDLFTLSLPSRIAKSLGALADLYGTPTADGILIEIHLPQQLIGDMNLASRESACNAVKKLADAGAVTRVGPGKIVIRNRALLDRLASDAFEPELT